MTHVRGTRIGGVEADFEMTIGASTPKIVGFVGDDVKAGRPGLDDDALGLPQKPATERQRKLRLKPGESRQTLVYDGRGDKPI